MPNNGVYFWFDRINGKDSGAAFLNIGAWWCFSLKIQRSSGNWYWAEYSSFSVASSSNYYKLTVSSTCSGDAGDAMSNPGWPANGKVFQTSDNVPTNYCISWVCATEPNCGGWWYSCCSSSLLNHDTVGSWASASATASGSVNFDVTSSRMFAELVW